MSNEKLQFNELSIMLLPDKHGIYFLFDREEIIYIGRAHGTGVSIPSRLTDHLKGKDGDCTKNASHFAYEVCSDPVNKEKELLATFKLQTGELPRCNERIG